jgi:Undecaprenyl-phosphate galactose phosphotransferase WbaP
MVKINLFHPAARPLILYANIIQTHRIALHFRADTHHDTDYPSLILMADNNKNTAKIIEFENEDNLSSTTYPRIRTLNRSLALYSRWFINILVLSIGDVATLCGSIYLGGVIRFNILGESMMLPDWPLQLFLVMLWLIAASFIKLLPGWGLGSVEELRRIVMLLVGSFAITAFLMFLGKTTEDYSRLTLGFALVISLIVLPLVRMQMKRLLIRTYLWGMQSVIYGDCETARVVVNSLKNEAGLGYDPIAVFDPISTNPPKEVKGLPVHQTHDENSVIASAAIIAMPQLSREELLRHIDIPLQTFRHVVIIPDLKDAPSLWVQPRDLGGILGLEISCNLLDPWSRALKRLTDLLLILIFSPILLAAMLTVAALILLTERKSPFFVQERIGKHGQNFHMWKFRTMRKDAEDYLAKQLAKDDKLRTEWEQNFKLRKDPRITRIGNFLRITSLDELPQIVNVLRGEMSLVGPRPLPDYHYDPLPHTVKALRERVRPGMTGLWQVSGRSETGTTGIEKWDSYYVRNWSIWLDIIIIIRTLRVVTSGRGAY